MTDTLNKKPRKIRQSRYGVDLTLKLEKLKDIPNITIKEICDELNLNKGQVGMLLRKNNWILKKIRKIDTDRQNNWKICSKCNKRKDLGDFYLSHTNNLYMSRCRNCQGYKYKREEKPRQKDIDIKNNHKICSECNIKKELDNFYYRNKQNVFEPNCIECKNNKRKTPERKLLAEKSRKERLKVNKHYQIKTILSSSLRHYMGSKKNGTRTSNYIGCDWNIMKIHIESKFKDGMSWDNRGKGYGKWVIDHILPCELFDFNDERQIFICFNYQNLQPLWFDENAIKSDILDDGRSCRFLSPEEKLNYLRSLGHDL